MARATSNRLADLELSLGYHFDDRSVLIRALTHASVRPSTKPKRGHDPGHPSSPAGQRKTPRHDYERLEFLGDRVLGLAIAELLWAADLEATEGELARRYNYLVCKEACARVAVGLDIGSHLILSAAEDQSGGRQKETILGDACESVLGAIFVDATFEQARAVILRHWQPLIDDMPSVAVDPKSQLQEWAQGQGLALPHYQMLGRTGLDHEPTFKTQVSVDGFAPATGTGPNKRSAEQAAAAALLQQQSLAEGNAAIPSPRDVHMNGDDNG